MFLKKNRKVKLARENNPAHAWVASTCQLPTWRGWSPTAWCCAPRMPRVCLHRLSSISREPNFNLWNGFFKPVWGLLVCYSCFWVTSVSLSLGRAISQPAASKSTLPAHTGTGKLELPQLPVGTVVGQRVTLGAFLVVGGTPLQGHPNPHHDFDYDLWGSRLGPSPQPFLIPERPPPIFYRPTWIHSGSLGMRATVSTNQAAKRTDPFPWEGSWERLSPCFLHWMDFLGDWPPHFGRPLITLTESEMNFVGNVNFKSSDCYVFLKQNPVGEEIIMLLLTCMPPDWLLTCM